MPENELSADQLVKDTICRIVRCTGERYTVSPRVTDALYTHVRRACLPLVTVLQGTPEDFSNLISCLRHRPVQLARVTQYFVILSSSSEAKECAVDSSDEVHRQSEGQDIEEVAEFADAAGVKALKRVCGSLGFSLPTESRPYDHSPRLAKGRQLRLSRIDATVSQLSVDEYLEFARFRQSGSFLHLCRPFARSRLIRWLFDLKANATDQPEPSEMRIDHQTLCILAHLMTGVVLDVIDTILFYRPKLGIAIGSPLTTVEVEQAVLQLTRDY